MASALQQLSISTVNITEKQHDNLIRQSEQLRILKNYAKSENVFTKEYIVELIKAMEAKNE